MYCYIPAAPRLACVKPVASVHPEPGSNSPLLLYLVYLFLCYPQTGELTAGRSLRLTEGFRPLPSSCILSHYFNVLSFVFRASFFRVASAKLSQNFELCKSFCKFFQNFFRRVSFETWPPLRYRRFSFCECKGRHFFITLQIFYKLFLKNFIVYRPHLYKSTNCQFYKKHKYRRSTTSCPFVTLKST